MTPAAILYYFPAAATGGGLGLFSRGLSGMPERYRGRFRTHTKVANAAGPDGGRGLLVTWQESVTLGHDPATQRWQRTGDLWRGVRTDYQPDEFRKPGGGAAGYNVRLGDDREWIVPVALANTPNYDVPWVEGLDEEGRVTRRADERYLAVCRAADTLWEAMTGDGKLQDLDEDDLRLACANALAVNYRLDLDDCLFLGLFTTESYRAIVRAILDMPAMEDMLKKKASDGPGMTSGAPAACLPTAQPMPMSA